MTAAIALVTCTDIPDLEDDDRLLLRPLAERGLPGEPVIWDDPSVDWGSYQLAILRSPWDYAIRRDEFVAWAGRVPRLVNDAAIVRWNTDKRYLAELAGGGVPVVDTRWVAPDETDVTLPDDGHWVIKPAISAGSLDTGSYRLPDERDLAGAHVRRLQAADRWTMIQPYLTAVDSYGETALMFFGGVYSHAVRKGPMLDGPDFGPVGDPDLYKPETITARTATADERALAGRVLAAIPAGLPAPLYARVDVIPGADGVPVLIELELTEPSLFLEHSDGAAERLAAAISHHLRGTGGR
jgi:hypothetical protein